MKEQGNLYLQGIGFEHLDSKRAFEAKLPFNINERTSYHELSKKIGHADFQDPSISYRKIWRLKKNNGETFNMVCVFSEDLTTCKMLYLLTYNSDTEYALVKNDLSS